MGGLDVVDPRFSAVYHRAVEVLDADERIDSVLISGSVGVGTADEWSDLDLQVVARADAYEDVLGDWPSWLAAITPTVFARTPIAPFIINAVTDQGLTLDIVVCKGEPFNVPRATDYAVGMLAGVRFASVADALEYAVAEQLRGLAGPFVSLVQRDENFRSLTGIGHLVGLLSTVFLAETGAPPPGKLWNQTFTPEQLAAVAALPAVTATNRGMVDFSLAIAKLMLTRARPLYAVYDLEWPAEFARVVANRLRECLDIEAGDWLC